ncbi:TolC family protein [Portibacter lacus]|uniref:TolC family protein n=1 Tax=Portibacter lacus TaxID=1099794 RepID=A0AA37SMY7_9BACT|nr:TolC family protein [Portibacter lacus]GLR17341.1 hypothetical protein GCM10007940_19560 [Portibacter lacus]
MKKLIFGLIILLSQNVNGQAVEELIEIAIQRNPGLQSIDLNYKAALEVADQVDDWPDPMANLGIGVLPIQTRLGSQQFKIGASQSIPWKGVLNGRSELANAQAETLSNVKDVQAIELAYNIRKAYNMLSFLTQKRETIIKKIEVLDVIETLAKSAVRSGKGKLSNVLLIERTRININADLELINKQMESPKIMINSLLGRSPFSNIDLKKPERTLSESEAYLAFAMKNHPQYKTLDHMKMASKKAIELTYLEAKPKLSVGFEYGWISKRTDVDIPNNGRDVFMPMGSISIPLNTSRFHAKRQEEIIKQEAIDASIQNFQERYSAEVRAAFSEIQYAEMSEVKYQDLIKITKETIDLMRTEYAAEGTRFEELLRLEMDLIDYEIEIVKAGYQKELAISSLKKFL